MNKWTNFSRTYLNSQILITSKKIMLHFSCTSAPLLSLRSGYHSVFLPPPLLGWVYIWLNCICWFIENLLFIKSAFGLALSQQFHSKSIVSLFACHCPVNKRGNWSLITNNHIFITGWSRHPSLIVISIINTVWLGWNLLPGRVEFYRLLAFYIVTCSLTPTPSS